jgi:hypothetical protein
VSKTTTCYAPETLPGQRFIFYSHFFCVGFDLSPATTLMLTTLSLYSLDTTLHLTAASGRDYFFLILFAGVGDAID